MTYTALMNTSSSDKRKQDTRSEIMQGLMTAWPICLGYVPLGLAFGAIEVSVDEKGRL